MTQSQAHSKIEEEMTEYPSIASDKMPVLEAIEFMKACGIRHLPVVDKTGVIGIVSERDLRQAELLSDSMTMNVGDVMTPRPYCVAVGTPLSEVAREMATQKYGAVIVLNPHHRVVGIFTTTDGMRLLSELLESESGKNLKSVGVEKLLSLHINSTLI